MPNKKKVPGEDEEYRNKRQRNNEAVKKSRNKARQKADETRKRVEDLRHKNASLEGKIEALKKDIKSSKDLFINLASTKPEKLTDEDKKLINAPDSDDEEEESLQYTDPDSH